MISSFALLSNNNSHGWDIDSMPKIVDNTGTLSFTDINSFYFSSNGLWLYIFGSDFYIRQYALSIPYDTRTAVDTSKSKLMSSFTTLSAPSFMVSTDGTKLSIRYDNFYINQLTLGTPYDITTATSNGSFYSDIGALTYTINYNGNKLYLYGGDEVLYEFTLSMPWDITTASTTGISKSFSGNGPGVYSIGIASDNTKLYFNSSSYDTIYNYTMSTPGDITSAISTSNWGYYGMFSQSTSGTMMFSQISASGIRAFIVDTQNNKLFSVENNIMNTYGIPKVTGYNAIELPVASTNQGIVLSTNGTKLFAVTGSTSECITTYTLNTPYNLTLGFSSYATSTLIANYISEMCISNDGTKLGLYDGTSSVYRLFTLSIPWDISSRVQVSTYSAISFFSFNSTGTKFYQRITGGITEYNLGTPWDLSTAIAGVSNTNLGTNSRYSFSPDGKVLLASGNTLNKLRQYNLSTAWSIDSVLEFANTSIPSGTYTSFSYTGDVAYTTMQDSNSIYIFSTNL